MEELDLEGLSILISLFFLGFVLKGVDVLRHCGECHLFSLQKQQASLSVIYTVNYQLFAAEICIDPSCSLQALLSCFNKQTKKEEIGSIFLLRNDNRLFVFCPDVDLY